MTRALPLLLCIPPVPDPCFPLPSVLLPPAEIPLPSLSLPPIRRPSSAQIATVVLQLQTLVNSSQATPVSTTMSATIISATVEPDTETAPPTARVLEPPLEFYPDLPAPVIFKVESPDTRVRIHHPMTLWNFLGRGETPRTCLQTLLLTLRQESPRAFESWGPAKVAVISTKLKPIAEVPKRVDLKVHVAAGARKLPAIPIEDPIYRILAIPNRGELGVFATRDISAGTGSHQISLTTWSSTSIQTRHQIYTQTKVFNFAMKLPEKILDAARSPVKAFFDLG